jgi:hypothetical protein
LFRAQVKAFRAERDIWNHKVVVGHRGWLSNGVECFLFTIRLRFRFCCCCWLECIFMGSSQDNAGECDFDGFMFSAIFRSASPRVFGSNAKRLSQTRRARN